MFIEISANVFQFVSVPKEFVLILFYKIKWIHRRCRLRQLLSLLHTVLSVLLFFGAWAGLRCLWRWLGAVKVDWRTSHDALFGDVNALDLWSGHFEHWIQQQSFLQVNVNESLARTMMKAWMAYHYGSQASSTSLSFHRLLCDSLQGFRCERQLDLIHS